MITGLPMRAATTQARYQWSLLVCAVLALPLLGGCGAVKKDQMTVTLQSATSGYHTALRWGNYPAAFGYLHPDLRSDKPLPAAFDGLQLTGYDVIQPPRILENESATQIVLIQYLYEDRQVVKELQDRQVWQWDEQKKSWWLKSGLPRFEFNRGD